MPLWKPRTYQQTALNYGLKNLLLNTEVGGSGLLLDPGLGKTSVTLALINALLKIRAVKKVLLVAPKRVIYSVWPKEIEQWDQFKHLKVSIVHGSPTLRMKAISTPADIYLTTPTSLPMVWEYFSLTGVESIPWDMLVIDESTMFKTWSKKRKSKALKLDDDGEPVEDDKPVRLGRMEALRKMMPAFTKRIILTGTPRSEGLQDLFSQVFIVDKGLSLGKSKSKFLNRYFYRGGFGGHQYYPHSTAERAIRDKISDCCLYMSREDYLDLPELVTNDVWIDLPTAVLKQYKQMERKMFIELEDGGNVTPLNAGGKYLACRQIANGGLYEEEDKNKWFHIHNEKIEAIEDIVNELSCKPVLIAYQFRHDLDRLRKVWHNLPAINGKTSEKEGDALLDKWNAGKLDRLAIHPQSVTHGLNMQTGPGRDLIFYGLDDSLERYLQVVARLYRSGVSSEVRIHRILARDTVDEAVRHRIENKDEAQKSFLQMLKEYHLRKKEG